jgi:hypothetical protein
MPARPRLSRLAALAAVVVALLGAAPPPSPVPADPEAIFAAARKAFGDAGYARYVQYVVEVAFRNGDTHVHRHYPTVEDMRRGILFADERSREERGDPGPAPHGTNFAILGMTINKPQPKDPIGPPALAIDYDFGIAPVLRKTKVAHFGGDVSNNTSLPVIGSTKTVAHDYDVRLIEMLDDGATYHLGLTPLRKPETYRLRELWISAADFHTQKALVASNFNRKPLTAVPWLIEFKYIDGAPYVWRETAQDVLDFGKAGTLDHVQVTFEDITTPNLLPWTLGIAISSESAVTEP